MKHTLAYPFWRKSEHHGNVLTPTSGHTRAKDNSGAATVIPLFSALSRGKFHFLLIQPNIPLGQVYAASTPHMQLTLKAKSKVEINGRNGKM